MSRFVALGVAVWLSIATASGVAASDVVDDDGLAPGSELPAIVADFKSAYESGDLERIRSLFTDDGLFVTTDDVLAAYWAGEVPIGQWDKDGAEFRRRASIHHGEMLITGAVEMDATTVAFDWEWEDFASGVAILHLRDDKIVVAVLAVSEVPI